jgi:hypothetical protein
MSKRTPKGHTVCRYLSDPDYNTWPTCTLARHLFNEHPETFTSERATRELIRAYRGQHNGKRTINPIDNKLRGYYATMHGETCHFRMRTMRGN